MRLIFFLAITFFGLSNLNAQMVAKVEVKEPIPGLCNSKDVYTLLAMFGGQKEAVCPVSEEEIVKRLDSAVTFLKDNPNHNDKGMVGVWINCKGEVVKCDMDNKTKDTILDAQIVAVFNSLGKWKPGLLKKKAVDSLQLFSFEIKNGKISL